MSIYDIDTENPLSLDAALRSMRECAESDDTEVSHIIADRILVNVLRQMGMGALCDEWMKVGKWYA